MIDATLGKINEKKKETYTCVFPRPIHTATDVSITVLLFIPRRLFSREDNPRASKALKFPRNSAKLHRGWSTRDEDTEERMNFRRPWNSTDTTCLQEALATKSFAVSRRIHAGPVSAWLNGGGTHRENRVDGWLSRERSVTRADGVNGLLLFPACTTSCKKYRDALAKRKNPHTFRLLANWWESNV